MKLYHCRDARSLRPMWALEELGLDYTLINLPFPPRYKAKGYKDLNPMGTVPTFLDGDLVLTESVAICHYLAERYGKDSPLWINSDDPEYGEFLNWLYRSDTTFTYPLTIVLRYQVLEPDERKLPRVAADYKQWFYARLRSVETALEDRDYLCGISEENPRGHLTIADICVGFAVYFAHRLGVDDEFGPNTQAYLQRILERPAFQRCLEKEKEFPSAL